MEFLEGELHLVLHPNNSNAVCVIVQFGVYGIKDVSVFVRH